MERQATIYRATAAIVECKNISWKFTWITKYGIPFPGGHSYTRNNKTIYHNSFKFENNHLLYNGCYQRIPLSCWTCLDPSYLVSPNPQKTGRAPMVLGWVIVGDESLHHSPTEYTLLKVSSYLFTQHFISWWLIDVVLYEVLQKMEF